MSAGQYLRPGDRREKLAPAAPHDDQRCEPQDQGFEPRVRPQRFELRRHLQVDEVEGPLGLGLVEPAECLLTVAEGGVDVGDVERRRVALGPELLQLGQRFLGRRVMGLDASALPVPRRPATGTAVWSSGAVC
jgi:hypothetical protein